MNLKEVLLGSQQDVNLSSFGRTVPGMPPLSWGKTAVNGVWGDSRSIIAPQIAVNGQGSLILSYKNTPGSLVSLEELEANPEAWNISQVQGIKSRNAYRLNTGLDCQRALGALIKTHAMKAETIVRQVRMPLLSNIEGIENVARKSADSVDDAHLSVAQAVGMQLSKEEGCFVADFSTSSWV